MADVLPPAIICVGYLLFVVTLGSSWKDPSCIPASGLEQDEIGPQAQVLLQLTTDY